MKRFFVFLIVVCFSANVFAQITKQQAADLVLNTIVGNKIDSVNVFVEPNIQSSDFYVISPIDSINVPYDNYWFFFIDEDPEYYWGHDCNYVFVNTENRTYSLYEKQIPPFLYLSFMDDVSISYPIRNSITNYNIDNRNDYIPTPEANVNDGKYAVLLNGGDNYNQIYFWNDISHNYAALIEHGYPKENIFVLSCDGNSMSYGGANPSMDLDGACVDADNPVFRLTIKNYYNTNQVIASNDRLRVLASSLANKCNEFDGNYEEAVTWYEDVLTSPQTSYNDSIFASIDLGNLYLKMESNGEKMNCGKLNEHKPKSYQQYLKQTNYALSLLPQQDYVNIEQIDDENNPVQNLNSMQNHLGYMMLTWDIPQNTNYDEKLLSWSNDIFYTACAVGVYEEQEALHYFTSDDISDYVGWRIKQIAFIPLGTENTHSIVIWEAFDEEKTLVYEQEIGNENLVFGEWNYIDLNDDFYFENDKNYYIGFSSDGHSNGHFIFPADNGEPNYGKNWIHIGESQWHCFDEAASYNLCIKTILENQDGKVINVDNSKNNKLTGYRVYANNEIVKEIKEPYITCYFDTEFESVNDIRYCVTAVYGDVESEPLCVKYVSVDEIAENSSTLNVHPNPTNGRIIIEKLNVSSVEIYNTQGQSVGRFNTNEIDMENLPSGMYFLVVKDRDGNINVGKVVRE